MDINDDDIDRLSDWFTIGPADRITLTETGKKELAPHFARAGISISSVKTLADYRRAMMLARPYLNDTLAAIARNGRMTIERKALLAIATGDTQEASRLTGRLRKIKAIGLVAID